MLKNKGLKSLLFIGASTLALSACAGTSGTINEAAEEFDSIETGELDFSYKVNSDTYGDYDIKMTGQFELVEGQGSSDAEETEEESDEQASSGLISKVHATEVEEEEPVEVELTEEEIEELELTEEDLQEVELISETTEDNPLDEGLEEVSPSRKYNYSIKEENSIYIDGQETTSVGEIIALDDLLYDKVFLTGSEADGRFVYDSRDVGIMEYPISDFLTVSPIIDAFDLENSDIEVTKGDLHNEEKGHVFTVTPEEVVTALQSQDGSQTTLEQNILGIVSEANVSEVIFGINENTFSVEAISTGNEEDTTPTSEASEDETETDTGRKVVGSMVITKTKGNVEITAPTNAMDIDEFSSLVELFYQQQAEEQLGSQISEDELYGEEAIEHDAEFGEDVTEEDLENSNVEWEEVELTDEEIEELERQLEEQEGSAEE